MSGSSFDPQVVEVLRRRYRELDRLAQSDSEPSPPSTADDVTAAALPKSRNRYDPAAEFERPAHAFSSANETDFLSSIASARQEAQTMFELSQDLGNSLSLGETLSVLSVRLRKMIPYDSIGGVPLERKSTDTRTGQRR